MWSNPRRSDRVAPPRVGPGSQLERLEARMLLSGSNDKYIGAGGLFGVYQPADLAVYNPITNRPSPYSVNTILRHNSPEQGSLLGNEGKVVSGKDRQGNEWTITVHGPGVVIVTDATPNDGSLDDAIDTIQLVGTDINKTYVTGNVVGSFRTQTNSSTQFNRLIDTSGVRSVILNGFTLARTVPNLTPTLADSNTGIYLTGGVRVLRFDNIIEPVDVSAGTVPINVIIGDRTSPVAVQPQITLNSIFNTVFDSTTTTVPANSPNTTPTVDFQVNGQLKSLSLISTSADTVPAADAFLYPTVATTGRTAVQALGIGTLDVAGAATNLTASRDAVPFQSGFSGLNHLKSARFRGPTDAVGLDVNGPIGSLTYDRGLGNPSGVFIGTTSTGAQVPATGYGLPADQTSFAAAGLVDGQVTATRIGRLKVRPANLIGQTSSNPDFVQIAGTGTAFTIYRPGTAVQNALIASSGDIGKVDIVGNSVNSEIKSGFHYGSFASGLEGTRAASKIGPLSQTGDQLNSVTSATYRPFLHFYGTSGDTAGPGKIVGRSTGSLYRTGGITPLTNIGAGFYARTKTGGYLPPPVKPIRNANGGLIRGLIQ